ncbi:hypothetical protein [Pseudonocardia alaniniphila]|uniref:DUF4253 domain-containing protein n=1 Tax=Pseudonocardia alaniniphila TaxID=75291 RepID=A0ABS9TBZ0_9PSEU|nr:hypothetical protein [Pseudonocardia alaniniphila]MCH6165801.1 hypothetical protein [Pseudonocardia alaniniphila]
MTDLDEHTLLTCLADAVAHARYWQPPDEADVLLADPVVAAALRPVAQAVVGSPTWRWWTSPLAENAQAHVQWTGQYATDPPRVTGAAEGLREWRRETLEAERRTQEWPGDPAASGSGPWWSTPAERRVVATSRALPDLSATQLMLVEDEMGWSQALVRPLGLVRPPRVYEVSGPQAWVDLVNRYPLEVSRSRRHDWWHTTGRVGRWFVPDWQAVAADHDAVHLSVAAYLVTPGRALEVAGGATVVAGWDPDATLWLTDLLAPAGEPVAWERYDDGGRWRWRPRA